MSFLNKKTKDVIEGKIWSGKHGDDYNALYIGYDSTPFSERFEKYSHKKVTIRYWITDEPKTKTQLVEDAIRKYSGDATAHYYDRYSDYTGYLWTESAAKVGGHDLLRELYSYKDKFLYLEIEY